MDESALGQLDFYIALRSMLHRKDNHTKLRELGMMDAVNDTLQALGILKTNESFISKYRQ